MMAARATIDGFRASVLRYFPERQIAVHSEGSVRLIKVGTRSQIMAAAFTTIIAGWLSIASLNMVATSGDEAAIQAKDAELSRMADQVASMKSSVTGLRGDVVQTAERLEKRQAFLANLLSGKADLRQLASLTPEDTGYAAADDPRRASLMAPFLKLERAQLAFVDRATTAAEARYRDTQALLARLGLDSTRFVGQSMLGGMGGPLEQLDGGRNPLNRVEPKFKDLFLSWKKVEQLETSMNAIPAAMPVVNASYSSGFGVRFDPFNGNAAMHAGVDLAGHNGEEIRATADGVVSRASWFGGYGNCIDLDHGKGLSTRYGHMSRLLVQPGQMVKKGDIIGLMGSTGRSTGNHLHYEVRVDGRAVNPSPYLQSATALSAIQDRSDDRGQGSTALAAN